MHKISKEKVVRLHLYQQRLYHEPAFSGKQGILKILGDLGLIQIDTINVVSKSHNLIFFSRLKDYKETDLIDLYTEKSVFESYVHAMSLLPMSQYPYVFHRLHQFRQDLFSKLKQDEIDFLLTVYHRIISEGPMTTKEISSKFYKSTSSLANWEMSPIRWALDQLWRSGMIHVVRDHRFHKLYVYSKAFFTEDDQVPKLSKKEINTHFCLSALKAIGVATVKDIADYYRIPIDTVRQSVQVLLYEKQVKEIEIEQIQESFFIRKEDEWLLSADTLKEEPSHICFLSPFDNLIWYRVRLLHLFNVDYRLESYLQKNQRKYGYYAMPILIKGKIIGTIDLKLERSKKTLVIKNIYLYNSFDADYYREELQNLLKRYAMFLKASQIQISDECWEKVHLSQSLNKLLKLII